MKKNIKKSIKPFVSKRLQEEQMNYLKGGRNTVPKPEGVRPKKRRKR